MCKLLKVCNVGAKININILVIHMFINTHESIIFLLSVKRKNSKFCPLYSEKLLKMALIHPLLFLKKLLIYATSAYVNCFCLNLILFSLS